ncbi:MAG: cysteine--tRNA ligase [Candidatus Tagabacteria bacterium CG10_big_fil_rev_8_21_14_0_10_40_13]|uniref:Cysteine--tRNA ligase n=1 Tax=Candidatus Tagabacteria bacterium CG10_big_fil_rev_8_21_14_0_10_40_13 TaxID=1975022 RepID=A0A2M8L984_9BACT|nr:MAG: cysteine--tRNA ligase [Candidatus Tagabacteria bacterium CG10_big_fil_rev_8_21_14_0_10_40_13]
MAIKFYNYLTRQKEPFNPIKKGRVGLYTCGPTVYDRVHLGNLRTFIFEDVLKKTLQLNGYRVKHVMNITDIDDKIIKKMKQEKKTLKQITLPYLKLFLQDIKKLNIERAAHFPKATENIKEMIKLIKVLLKKGMAYKGKDNSIYFDISKFQTYGALSELTKQNIRHGARIENDEYSKKNAGDFVLWKAFNSIQDKSLTAWNAAFGKGRPGWHIECSAMSMKYLGKTFDIHAGAVDLLFPHHENEIAQSEAATGQKFVNYWLEAEHLLVENQKMSKSLGNFYTLRDIEKRNINPLAFRYLALNSHYRSKLNFTWNAVQKAEESLKNLRSLSFRKIIKREPRNAKKEKEYETKFIEALNNDLNTPRSLTTTWELARDAETPQTSKDKLIEKFDKVLKLGLKTDFRIPAEITKMAKNREKLRRENNYEKADQLRQKADNLGWIMEDTPSGPAIRKKL